MLSSHLITLAPMNNGYYPMNTNLVNNPYSPQLHPCQVQSYPVQYIVPQTYCQLPQFSLNTPVPFCPSPVHYTQPPLISVIQTPSPSPPPSFDMRLPKMEMGHQPRLVTDNRSISVGGAGSSQSSEGGNAILREFYSFNIVKQKASIGEMVNRFEHGLVRAMRNTLQIPSIDFSIHLIPSKKNKNITIRWIINQEKFDFSSLKQRTLRLDFEKKLICELAKIDEGSFNTYLSGAKQLTIINEGWSCLLKLKDSLISRKGTLGRLLAVPEVERFEEEAIKNLYKVSEDDKGMALRGPTVVGVRFKLQSDILKMPKFVEKVKNFIGIQRSTMIASLKTHKQYKGWSVYLDVATLENVKLVEELSQTMGFEKTKVFVAEDNF